MIKTISYITHKVRAKKTYRLLIQQTDCKKGLFYSKFVNLVNELTKP